MIQVRFNLFTSNKAPNDGTSDQLAKIEAHKNMSYWQHLHYDVIIITTITISNLSIFYLSVYLTFYFFLFQCVFEIDKEKGLTLTELADGVSVEDVLVSTGCEFDVAPELKKMGDITQIES